MKKINKVQAKKLWDVGEAFWMTACNMRPYAGILIDYKRFDEFNGDFEKLYNTFSYYNCDNERGRYPAFYVD